ncbi:Barwin family [Phytophthora infestans]|uniref:Barwin family n=1 Tax=Phytophthora infestans TaxID=4787 RepID=A0A833SS21_PHYIN|nr:Barwin family [Phytophthora infestans]
MLYTHENFASGHCNFMYDPGVGNYFAALNSDQWDSTLNCGRCAEVSSGGTSSVTVYIVDQCTECEDEGLGLSPLVFKQLTRSDSSQNIKWKFVDCPVSGNIEYCNCTEGTSNFAASSNYQESEVNEYFDTLKSGDGGYTAGKVTAPDDAEQIVARSEATSSGTNLLFLVPLLLLVVGGFVLVYIFKKNKRLSSQHLDRAKEKSAFGTLNSPVLVKETIAKI